jgi:hypothetical protein
MVLSWAVEGGACGYGSFSVKQCADRIALASLLCIMRSDPLLLFKFVPLSCIRVRPVEAFEDI